MNYRTYPETEELYSQNKEVVEKENTDYQTKLCYKCHGNKLFLQLLESYKKQREQVEHKNL